MPLFQRAANADEPCSPTVQAGGFPLALAAAGERVRIVEVNGGAGLAKRLDAMGLRLGSEFQVLQREGAGGMLVRVASTRLALGAGMQHRIRVCKL